MDFCEIDAFVYASGWWMNWLYLSNLRHIEQKYQAEVKALQAVIDEERDAHSHQLETLRDKMEKQIDTLKQKEDSLKQDLGAAQRVGEKWPGFGLLPVKVFP